MSSEWAEQPVPGNAAATPGQALAAQREAMGWTVEQVADQLKMAVRQVVALEAGDYASLPGPAVVRGFVRAYAKVVKLDAAPLVAMISMESESGPDTTPRTVRRDKPASFSEVRFPSNGKRANVPYALIGLGVLVLGAGFAAWHFGLVPGALLGASRAPAPVASAPSASATIALPPPVVMDNKPADDSKPVQSTSVPLISVPPPVSSGQNATLPPAPGANPAPGAPAVAAPAAAQAAAPAAPDALVLTVREDSWIEVRRAKGAPLLKRMVKAGSVETLSIKEPVTLIVGNPSAVQASLRGNAVELPPMPGKSLARVKLQ